jgi:predicted molibdopterin-dependent oxidoreductase YjgC
MGALPNVYPGYQSVDNPEIQEKFESAWGCKLNSKPGLTATMMTGAMYEGRVKAMFVVGENPLMSEPHLNHARDAMERLAFLVVQDIFPTETALMADVILPAAVFAEKDGTYTNTERRPGEAKPDWEIINMLADRMGHSFGFKNTAEIMDEIASLTPSYGGISHNRLDTGGLQWPCPNRDHPGTPLLHQDLFTRGKGKFHAVEYKSPAESTSEEYPLILTTGRMLEHWHTGSMSRRSDVLDALQPNGMIDIHPDDALKLGIKDGDIVAVSSARGKIETRAHITDKAAPGVTYMAFHWSEAPANILTSPALDPSAKIPEYKVSAVKAELSVIDKGGQENK